MRDETATARTLLFDVPDWPGHLAGQHVDIRLTADDGYQAARSYSLAEPTQGDQIALTVQRVVDGEVSPYLAAELQVDDRIEIRGPLGNWFVWRPTDAEPVLLGRRWRGHRPVDGDGARAPGRTKPRSVPAHLLGTHAGRPVLPG